MAMKKIDDKKQSVVELMIWDFVFQVRQISRQTKIDLSSKQDSELTKHFSPLIGSM